MRDPGVYIYRWSRSYIMSMVKSNVNLSWYQHRSRALVYKQNLHFYLFIYKQKNNIVYKIHIIIIFILQVSRNRTFHNI